MPDLDRLPRLWHAAPRRWGHRLHSMCSYMAMFPPSLPHVFIKWLSKPGDVVYDPFAGRGSTPLEACLLGRVGCGSDANPLAWLLSSAKVDPPTSQTLLRRFNELREDLRTLSVNSQPEHVRMLFADETLGQLLWLRRNLDLTRKSDRFIMGVLLGMLHANADTAGTPRGFTVAMPNTFAMAPGYVARYIKSHRLVPPSVDVLPKLKARALSLVDLPATFSAGQAWVRDATAACTGLVAEEPARLLFASPPYLEVMLYGKLNWIRLWMLQREPKQVDSTLFTSGSVDKYVTFMKQTISASRAAVRDGGFACFVIGDVRRRKAGGKVVNLAATVAENCVEGSGFRVLGIVDDRLPVKHKVSRIWGETRGKATRTDRVLVLGTKHSRLPSTLPKISWTTA